MPFFLSTVNPNSLVMMMLPGITLGQKPSVNASVSESVAGSTSHDAAVPLVAGAVAALPSAVIAAEGGLAPESLCPSLFAIDVNVYGVPAVRPVMMHDPDAPVTVHVLPSGDEVTRYDLGVSPPVGAVTVIVTPSSLAIAVGIPGAFNR